MCSTETGNQSARIHSRRRIMKHRCAFCHQRQCSPFELWFLKSSTQRRPSGTESWETLCYFYTPIKGIEHFSNARWLIYLLLINTTKNLSRDNHLPRGKSHRDDASQARIRSFADIELIFAKAQTSDEPTSNDQWSILVLCCNLLQVKRGRVKFSYCESVSVPCVV